MRTWFTSALLAASALMPAIASAQQVPDDRGDRGVRREQRDPEQGGPRADRRQYQGQHRGQQGDPRVQGQAQAGVQVQQQAGGNPDARGRPNFGPNAPGGQGGYAGRGDQGRPGFGPNAPGGQGGYAGRGDQGRPGFGPNAPGGQGGYAGRGGYQGYNGGQRGGPGGYVGHDDGRGGWNRGWRGDRRYDYGGYRAENRGAYRLPRYYAPSNWHGGYRRFSVGVTLGYGLFGGNYWIGNPYAYRLPPAYGPYRWVRYYNDALLVDTRSGYVVDAVYDIFW